MNGIDPTTCSSWTQLTQLASSPFDLTSTGAFSSRRIAEMRCSACGLDLLYGTERLNRRVLRALQQLARQTDAIGQFRAMMQGGMMNSTAGVGCERRKVLHTATRNVFADLACDTDPGQAEEVEQANTELAKLRDFLKALDDGTLVNGNGESFTDLIQVGIGGSDLGPRAIYLALPEFRRKDRRVHFISNVDPDDVAQVLPHLDLTRTLVIVVSKSGTTLETRTNEQLVAEQFRAQGLDPRQHFLAVTGRGSPADNPTRYLRTFYMYDYIGGRYSSTSMVGAVALSFGLGFARFREILRGARTMDLNALETDLPKNLALLSALLGIWNRNFLLYPTLAVIPYSQLLSRFVAHLQQLDMESNGKRVNREGNPIDYPTGPVLWGEAGTNGQHAFFQLLHQSETIVPCLFVAFRQPQGTIDTDVDGTTSQQKLLSNVIGQAKALATGDPGPGASNKEFPGNRPTSLLVADRLTPCTLGSLLAFFENRTAFQGFLWNINSFDQEGVQLGKRIATDVLDHFQGQGTDPVCQALLAAARLP